MISSELKPRYMIAYEAGNSRWLAVGGFEKDFSTAMRIAVRLNKNGFSSAIYECAPEPIVELYPDGSARRLSVHNSNCS